MYFHVGLFITSVVEESRDLLHIGTFITHSLLSHLEATRSELCRPHLLSAVTLPLARSFFGYGFVTYNLHKKTGTRKDVTR